MVRAVSARLPSQADKPRYVAAMFERIARRYDLMNTLMTAGQDQRWRRMVAELATTRHSTWILDVGTGTGRLGRAVRQANPSAHVVGIDFAQGMLRRASPDIHPTRADAVRLPFADEQFDWVITLCDKVREVCPEFPAAPISAHWSIPDPSASGDDDDATYAQFQDVADEIEARVALLLIDLRTGPLERTHHG